jgi:DNA-binding response OmpR family regulator
MNILLIEDESRIADFVTKGLSAAGYSVRHVDNGVEGLQVLLTSPPDLVVLDVMLPLLSGFEVLKQARAKQNHTPVIILSAKSDLDDRLTGFDVGADDYLPKPFFVEELVARIRVLMKRRSPEQMSTVTIEGLTLDVVRRKAQWRDVSAILSQREFSLLEYLMRSPGQIYSRKQILEHVWEINFDPQTNVVDVCIQRIKKKLCRGGNDSDSPIESVRGVGYRLRIKESA